MNEEPVFVEWMYDSQLDYLFIIIKQEPKLCGIIPPKHWSVDFIPIPLFFPVSTSLLEMENILHYVG